MQYYIEIVARLVLACVLGGIIGYEREHGNRPAGFRTHILVCVGAALVMVTSEYVFKVFSGKTNLDPARLGAQVISGIGFLGAGTIVREGFNVKGLTTAASLWAVSCVGLAAGIGFYEGAVISTILIYITLMLLKKMEKQIAVKKQYRNIIIEAANIPEIIYRLTDVFSRYDVLIKNIEYYNGEKKDSILVKFLIKPPHTFSLEDIVLDFCNIDGVHKVYEE
ncbi:MAG: MgtC/SapB family protein [Firmicutes bacterium]|nr:MgtC/SapB family protein [Bacillota bacterium]